mmetsp:Transcript_2356/g.5035  ORF Transcript_2356/g.5035 Transcript_2356/m.5035 type:complete len:230 (-) Transcript_2356:17-706(-)
MGLQPGETAGAHAQGRIRVGTKEGQDAQLLHRLRQDRARTQQGLEREHPGGRNYPRKMVRLPAGGAQVAAEDEEDDQKTRGDAHPHGTVPAPAGGALQKPEAVGTRGTREHQHSHPGGRRRRRHGGHDQDRTEPAAETARVDHAPADPRRGDPRGTGGDGGGGVRGGDRVHAAALGVRAGGDGGAAPGGRDVRAHELVRCQVGRGGRTGSRCRKWCRRSSRGPRLVGHC